MARVVVLLAEGFEEIEAITPIDYLRRAGVQVETVAVPVGGKADPLVIGAHKIPVKADMTFDELAMREGGLPDGVFVPGGMPGATHLAAHQGLRSELWNHNNKGGHVAAICASPAIVLAPLGIITGRNAVCYPGMEKGVSGVKWGASRVAVDSNVVTGNGPASAMDFALKLVEISAGEETARAVADGMLFFR